VRAALEDAWPALSETFGLMPWDVERLTLGELNAYSDALRRRAKQQRG
jgi:hypothetical protein